MTAPVTVPASITDTRWWIDDLEFGWPRTDYTVSSFEIGDVDDRISSEPSAREDGQRFGRDYLNGRTISFQLHALDTGYGVLDKVATFASAWRPERVRLVPGAVSALSWERGGQRRRVYGRGRRLTPSTGLDWTGNVPITCDFETSDHKFYEDAEAGVVIGFVPDGVGGFTPPLIGPLTMSGEGVGTSGIRVGGTESAWLTMRVNGPITRPTVEVTDQWSVTLDVVLADDQWVLVDPSPWGRTVRRNDGANLSGAFTAQSERLSQLRVPPGTHQVVLRGTDPTGTSSVSCFWRAAYASY